MFSCNGFPLRGWLLKTFFLTWYKKYNVNLNCKIKVNFCFSCKQQAIPSINKDIVYLFVYDKILPCMQDLREKNGKWLVRLYVEEKILKIVMSSQLNFLVD
jgi:hypothetical protein